jgi:uncharacterized protein (UPF0335 family)
MLKYEADLVADLWKEFNEAFVASENILLQEKLSQVNQVYFKMRREHCRDLRDKMQSVLAQLKKEKFDKRLLRTIYPLTEEHIQKCVDFLISHKDMLVKKREEKERLEAEKALLKEEQKV